MSVDSDLATVREALHMGGEQDAFARVEARVEALEAALTKIAYGKERVAVTGTTGVSGRPRFLYQLDARLAAAAALAAANSETGGADA